MTTTVSKFDNKVWFKVVATKEAHNVSVDNDFSLIAGETYWVRKAEDANYCIIRGTFNSCKDAMANIMNPKSINSYNGTYSFGKQISKAKAKSFLQYV